MTEQETPSCRRGNQTHILPLSQIAIPVGCTPRNEATGKMVEAVTLNYGNFIQTTIDFLIIAFSIFIAIKFMNKLRTKKEETPAPAAPPAPSKEEVLLTEIRDILKEKH